VENLELREFLEAVDDSFAMLKGSFLMLCEGQDDCRHLSNQACRMLNEVLNEEMLNPADPDFDYHLFMFIFTAGVTVVQDWAGRKALEYMEMDEE